MASLNPMLKKIVLINLFAIFVIILCGISLNETGSILVYLRWIFGIPFVFFVVGYLATRVIFPRNGSIGFGERIILSFAFSLLATYPAGFINVLLEGKENIFQPHLLGFMSILVAFTFILSFIWWFREGRKPSCRKGRIPSFTVLKYLKNKFQSIRNAKATLLILILAISTFFNFCDLNRADVHVDEVDIGYRAYDLVDGMVAGRQAYCLSFSTHSPLGKYINHATMQVLNPLGFYQLEDWMLRVGGAITGVLTVFAVYLLGRRMFNEKVGLISASLVAISNYHVWISRLALLEPFLTFFMVIATLFFYSFLQGNRIHGFVAGLFLGAAMLVKFSGVLLIPIFLICIIIKERKLNKELLKPFVIALIVFSPVILYNIGAYLTTGYMDVSFARVARLLGLEVSSAVEYGAGIFFGVGNFTNLICTLIDLYALPLFLLFGFATLASIFYASKTKDSSILILLIWILITVLFFWVGGFRAYYLPFITPPFAILAGYLINKNLESRFRKKALPKQKAILTATALLLGSIITYSAFYTYNTNISSSYSYHPGVEYGRSGYPILTPSLEYHFSRSARPWSDTHGYKDLRAFVDANLTGGDLLVVGNNINIVVVRWYLHVADNVRAYYLKEAYKTKSDYIFLSQLENTDIEKYDKILVVTLENTMENYTLVKTIYDLNAQPTLYIYCNRTLSQ